MKNKLLTYLLSTEAKKTALVLILASLLCVPFALSSCRQESTDTEDSVSDSYSSSEDTESTPDSDSSDTVVPDTPSESESAATPETSTRPETSSTPDTDTTPDTDRGTQPPLPPETTAPAESGSTAPDTTISPDTTLSPDTTASPEQTTALPEDEDAPRLESSETVSDALRVDIITHGGYASHANHTHPLVIEKNDGEYTEYIFYDMRGDRPVRLPSGELKKVVEYDGNSYLVDLVWCRDGEGNISIINRDYTDTEPMAIPGSSEQIILLLNIPEQQSDMPLLAESEGEVRHRVYPVLYTLPDERYPDGRIDDVLDGIDLSAVGSIEGVSAISDSLSHVVFESSVGAILYNLGDSSCHVLDAGAFHYFFISDGVLFYYVDDGVMRGYTLEAKADAQPRLVFDMSRYSSDAAFLIRRNVSAAAVIFASERRAVVVDLRDGTETEFSGFDFSDQAPFDVSPDGESVVFSKYTAMPDGTEHVSSILICDLSSGLSLTIERQGGGYESAAHFVSSERVAVSSTVYVGEETKNTIYLYTFDSESFTQDSSGGSGEGTDPDVTTSPEGDGTTSTPDTTDAPSSTDTPDTTDTPSTEQ